jgi:hypothetical protein
MEAIQTDSIIYQILKNSGMLDITGDVYTAGERPANSTAEDIVINNINFEHSTPRRGISNINIHVADIVVTIDGIQQRKTNRDRLNAIAQTVQTVIDSTTINGVSLRIETTQVFAEEAEHYLNMRCAWIIAEPLNELSIQPNPIFTRLNQLTAQIADLQTRLETAENTIKEITNNN